MAKYKRRPDGRYATTITVCINGEKKKKYVYGKTIKDVDKSGCPRFDPLIACHYKTALFNDLVSKH